MKGIVRRLRQCSGSYTKINGGNVIQVYSNGQQGNIKRLDESVLCRFEINDIYFSVAPAKMNNPTEFGYEKYFIPITADASVMKRIPHSDADEIYIAFMLFVATQPLNIQ